MSETEASAPTPTKKPVNSDITRVVVRFAGDSGDGMQLTGTEFTRSAALAGNDISTFPDFPAEIRAPAGTLAGVSGFQLHFASEAIYTPGDTPDVLVAMNPAALKKNIADLKKGGLVIANSGAFNDVNLRKVNYESNPIEDDSLSEYRLVSVDMNQSVQTALDGMGLTHAEIARSKNFWALGLMYFLYNRPTQKQVEWIEAKFKKRPEIAAANVKAFNVGWAFGETTELIGETYQVERAPMEAGTYRNIMGNQALVAGLVAAAHQSELPMFYGSYPITPASDVLHGLAKHRHYGVTTFQAEDEIAAIGAAIGASFGGAIGVTGTSGPGLALKGEALGLAAMLELPLVVVNVQRGGPSTGLPTKTEQSDLLQVMYGRNGECPLPVIAGASPADCFMAAFEAVQVALKYMTPVILLSDGYIANGAEPWKIPAPESLPKIDVQFRTDPAGYQVYARDPNTLARDWVIPGTPGLQHRVGGLEKDFLTGDVSYDPQNHQKMCDTREEKVMRVQQDIPAIEIEGDKDADLVCVSWGGTYGTVKVAVMREREAGKKVAHIHLRWINPFPQDLGDVLGRFKKVLVCELNKGQLVKLLRSEFLLDAIPYNKVEGQPFQVQELRDQIEKHA